MALTWSAGTSITLPDGETIRGIGGYNTDNHIYAATSFGLRILTPEGARVTQNEVADSSLASRGHLDFTEDDSIYFAYGRYTPNTGIQTSYIVIPYTPPSTKGTTKTFTTELGKIPVNGLSAGICADPANSDNMIMFWRKPGENVKGHRWRISDYALVGSEIDMFEVDDNKPPLNMSAASRHNAGMHLMYAGTDFTSILSYDKDLNFIERTEFPRTDPPIEGGITYLGNTLYIVANNRLFSAEDSLMIDGSDSPEQEVATVFPAGTIDGIPVQFTLLRQGHATVNVNIATRATEVDDGGKSVFLNKVDVVKASSIPCLMSTGFTRIYIGLYIYNNAQVQYMTDFVPQTRIAAQLDDVIWVDEEEMGIMPGDEIPGTRLPIIDILQDGAVGQVVLRSSGVLSFAQGKAST